MKCFSAGLCFRIGLSASHDISGDISARYDCSYVLFSRP